MKKIIIAVLAASCVSCSAKIVVTKIGETPSKLDAPSAYYALPKTRILITVPYTRRVYKPGALEVYFEAHKDEFDLKPAKPSDWDKCAEDRGEDDPQTRYQFEVIDKLRTTPIPDPNKIFAVRMRADGFQDIKVGLELSPDMIVGAASGSSTSASSTITDILVKSLTDHDEESDTDGQVDPKRDLRKLRDDARKKVVSRLRMLDRRRDQILLSSSDTQDAEAILSRIEAEQRKLKTEFEGSYSEKKDTFLVVWTPPANTSGPANLCCTVVNATRCNLNLKNDSSHLNCADHVDCNKRPDGLLFVHAIEDAETYAIRKRMLRADYLKDGDDEDKGFAYNVPAFTVLSVQRRSSSSLTTLGEFETYIAQFGDVFRLPADIGTGKTEFTVTYHPELGALKTLSASGISMGTETLKQAALDALEPEDELSELERRYKILDYEEKIRQLEERQPEADGDTADP